MFDHAMRRCLIPLAAAMLLAGCNDAPTLPTSRVAPRAAAASIAPPAGTIPLVSQSIYRIVDANDNEIWQNIADAPFSGGFFTLAMAGPGAALVPCGLEVGGLFQIIACHGNVGGVTAVGMMWKTTIVATGDQCVHDNTTVDEKYPLAMWVWSPSPLVIPCRSFEYDGFAKFPTGARIQVTAAPTAPGGLVFRRWDVRISGALLPCAEGTASPTCTVTATQDYIGIGVTYTLVYGNEYPFTGFFSPVNNAPTVNVVKAGSSMPVKFSLGGNRGLGILASGSPASVQVACDLAAASDDVETTVNAGSSSLTYNATADQYTYVWKTEKGWAGTCREFRLMLDDETVHTATFRFNK